MRLVIHIDEITKLKNKYKEEQEIAKMLHNDILYLKVTCKLIGIMELENKILDYTKWENERMRG